MVVSLIQSNQFIGAESEEISTILGEETGDYYQSDLNITYRLTNYGNADWILTFKTDDTGKVNDVFIRKSCCSLSKRLFNFIYLKFFEKFILPFLTAEKF
jgi:hypothetical protein